MIPSAQDKRIQRAVAFALKRSTPFTTTHFVRVIYSVDTAGMSEAALYSHCKSATRIMGIARARLAAAQGGKWFVYDKKTSMWRARAHP